MLPRLANLVFLMPGTGCYELCKFIQQINYPRKASGNRGEQNYPQQSENEANRSGCAECFKYHVQAGTSL